MSTPNAERGLRSKTAAFLSSGSTRKGTPLLYAYGSSKTAGRNVVASPKRREALLYHLLALPFTLAGIGLAALLMWGIWAVVS